MADAAQVSKEGLICIQDYEDHAEKTLPELVWVFYRGGSNQEQSLQDNRDAFKRWRLMPRVLRGVSNRSLTTTVLGNVKVSAPFGIAPMSMQKMAHDEGECATARAAMAEGIVYVMSTAATCTVEEVGEAAPNGNNWFQLYVYKDRQETVDAIRRVEKAGFKALVVTVDSVLLGRRLGLERKELSMGGDATSGGFTANYVSEIYDGALGWKDIVWLKSITSLPIMVKGILRPDDATLAAEHGVSAVIVSNHGGRQLDGVPATIDVLEGIVKQVRGRCQVYVDGGITQGTDILKALALGADMVFVGRPILWGLAHSGEEGVRNVIQLLKKELDLAMALSGCSAIKDIDRSLVLRQDFYSSL